MDLHTDIVEAFFIGKCASSVIIYSSFNSNHPFNYLILLYRDVKLDNILLDGDGGVKL